MKTKAFHLGDYRRATVGPGKDVPDDYFFVNGQSLVIHMSFPRHSSLLTLTTLAASASSVLLRQKILKKCREDIYHFLNIENGQIAIYDAVNALSSGRKALAKEFAKHEVQVGPSSYSVEISEAERPLCSPTWRSAIALP